MVRTVLQARSSLLTLFCVLLNSFQGRICHPLESFLHKTRIFVKIPRQDMLFPQKCVKKYHVRMSLKQHTTTEDTKAILG